MKIFEKLLYFCIVTTITFSVCWISTNNRIIDICLINLSYLLLFCADIYLLCAKKTNIFKIVYQAIKGNKLFIVLILYVLYEIFNIINGIQNGQFSYLINKIMIILKLGFLLSNIILYIYSNNKSFERKKKNIFLSFGVSTYIIILFTLIKYFSGNFILLTRIAPVNDYNVFAVTLLFTGSVMVHYIIKYLNGKTRLILLTITIALVFSIVYLSGSRRGILFIYICIIAYILLYLLFYKNKFGKINFNNIISCTLIAAVCFICCNLAFSGFNDYVEAYANAAREAVEQEETNPDLEMNNEKQEKEENLIDNKVDSNEISEPGPKNPTSAEESSENGSSDKTQNVPGFGETRLEDRYETINISEGLSSRSLVWEIAIKEIKKMDALEIIFGRGSGYNLSIYQTEENASLINPDVEPQEIKYDPHNIILNDILEGGIIKILFIIIIVVMVIYIALKNIKYNNQESILILCVGMILGATLMLSARTGLLGNDLFWHLVILTFLAQCNIKLERERENLI